MDKAHAHVNQTFLEYGPDVTSLRAAFKAVRGCLSDMGTERSIGDVPDCIDAFLNRDVRAPAAGESFLFPRALQIPGLQHIIDNAVREAVSRTPWWSEWEAKAKVVCQHVGRQGHRDRLVHVLRTSLDPVVVASKVDFEDAVARGCDRFAEWRWSTLRHVTEALQRLGPALRAVEASSGEHLAAVLGLQDAGELAGAIRDGALWARADFLERALRPLHDFAGRVRGCRCHDLRAASVPCPFKGCRAPELSAKLKAVVWEICQAREGELVGRLGLDPGDVVAFYGRLLAFLRAKFAWVDELPYFVWQVDSPAGAQQFLSMHDAMVQRGERPHRV
ncbi:MAG: hypothetical protein GY772_24465, partial [bacterium]|nr:hypothetical protein [bacterium]